jgi:hypothetical protein
MQQKQQQQHKQKETAYALLAWHGVGKAARKSEANLPVQCGLKCEVLAALWSKKEEEEQKEEAVKRVELTKVQ